MLGPILFNVYMLPLGDVIRQYGIIYNMYADDNQLYINFKPADVSKACTEMMPLASDVRAWLTGNMLLKGAVERLKTVMLQFW